MLTRALFLVLLICGVATPVLAEEIYREVSVPPEVIGEIVSRVKYLHGTGRY